MKKHEQAALENSMEYFYSNAVNQVEIVRHLRKKNLITEDQGYAILNELTARLRNKQLFEQLNKSTNLQDSLSDLMETLRITGNDSCVKMLQKELKRQKDLSENADVIFQDVLAQSIITISRVVANQVKLVMTLRQKNVLTEEEGYVILSEETPFERNFKLLTVIKNKKVAKDVLVECLLSSGNFHATHCLEEAFEKWNGNDVLTTNTGSKNCNKRQGSNAGIFVSGNGNVFAGESVIGKSVTYAHNHERSRVL